VNERSVTAIAVEDQDRLHPIIAMQAPADLRWSAKQQTALIERLTDNENK
jgi:hypothetical protein